jgi:hypothetical protein
MGAEFPGWGRKRKAMMAAISEISAGMVLNGLAYMLPKLRRDVLWIWRIVW